MSYFFTSDTHYDHGNIIRYSDRPFARVHGMAEGLLDRPSRLGYVREETWTWPDVDVEAMKEAFIANWNRVVEPGDRVFHLGDFMMGPGGTMKERARAVRERLNGQITLVLGNHDRSPALYSGAGFDRVSHALRDERVGGYRLHMTHVPPSDRELQDLKGPYDLILCGHMHEEWKRRGRVINVGVDQWGYTPVSLEELIRYSTSKEE